MCVSEKAWKGFSSTTISKMATIDVEAIKHLENGTNQSTYIDAVTILLKILDNILREPHNTKYRTIRLENKIVKEKLLTLNGMRTLLEHIGFVEVRILNFSLHWIRPFQPKISHFRMKGLWICPRTHWSLTFEIIDNKSPIVFNLSWMVTRSRHRPQHHQLAPWRKRNASESFHWGHSTSALDSTKLS